METRPHQLLVRDAVRLVGVRPLPPLQVLDVRLVVPLEAANVGV
jgi:hypothetical protein